MYHRIKKLISKREFVILFLIIVAALFLRSYQLEKRTAFGADQEELSFKAIELLGGDPVLLGLTTSVGRFAIGPLFTYLWTLFFFIFSGDPVAGSFLSIFLGVLTTILFFIAGKIFFKSNVTSLFLASIYAFSHASYVWDISPWPPSLFYISQILLTLGAFLALTNPIGFAVSALGFSIGFSSHISIFVSLVPILVFWVLKKPDFKNKKAVLTSLIIVFFGILPNLIFDLTHRFENTQRLFGLFVNSGSEVLHPASIRKIFFSLWQSTTEFFIPYTNRTKALVFFSGTLILAGYFFFKGKKPDLLALLLLSLLVPPFIFLFWRGNFSEYYLTLSAVPPFILLVGYLFNKFYNSHRIIILTLFLIFLFINISAWSKRVRPLNLAAMKKAVELIVEKGGQDGYGVSLTTEPGYQFGYSYLFHYYGASPDTPPKKDQSKIFSIIIPSNYHGIQSMVEFDGIGVLWKGVE